MDRLRCHLARRGIAVGLSTLSDWQSGRNRPEQANSLRAVRAIEDILTLPEGSLTHLLRRPGLPDIGEVAELLDALPGSRDRGVELVSVHQKVVIDEGRQTELLWTRTAIRAVRDGIDRYVVRYYGNPTCVPALVRPEALDNCRLGRVVPHQTGQALIFELLFDQKLTAGETWVFESQVSDPTSGLTTEFAHGFRHPADQYLLEVRFHPGQLPLRCWSFAQLDLHDDRHPTADLTLSKHNTVHLISSGITSGVLGIKWDWPQMAGL